MKRIFLGASILLTAIFLLTSCNNAASGNTAANNTANTNKSNTGITNANTVTSSANSEADIKKLMDDAAAALAKNDTAALDKIYADDYVLINQDGVMQSKTERFDSMKSGELKYESFAYSDTKIRFYGDTAVVNAVATIKAVNKGKPLDGKFRVTQVDVKGKDGWRMVSAQATETK